MSVRSHNIGNVLHEEPECLTVAFQDIAPREQISRLWRGFQTTLFQYWQDRRSHSKVRWFILPWWRLIYILCSRNNCSHFNSHFLYFLALACGHQTYRNAESHVVCLIVKSGRKRAFLSLTSALYLPQAVGVIVFIFWGFYLLVLDLYFILLRFSFVMIVSHIR